MEPTQDEESVSPPEGETPMYDELVNELGDPFAPLPPRPPVVQTRPGPACDPVVGTS